MTLTEYFSQHVRGAWRLLWWDESGLESFDQSDEGFYRSFGAMGVAFVLLIPVFMADHRAGLEFAAGTPDVRFAMPLTVYLATEFVVGIFGWAVFLMLMVPFARAFGVVDRFVPYVIAYNWTSLLMVSFGFVLALFQLAGLVPWDMALAVQLVFAFVFLLYSWFVAVTALRLPALDAAAVVAMELAIYLVLARPTEALYAQYGG